MKDHDQTSARTPAQAAAAARAAHVKALREEREGLERAGKEDRIAAVDAEIKRLTEAPVKRSETPTDPPIQGSPVDQAPVKRSEPPTEPDPKRSEPPTDAKPKSVIHAKKG